MVTRLERPLRRELSVEGKPYVLTITPTGFVLAEKGRRKGYEMNWVSFVSGDAALSTALNASIAMAPRAPKTVEKPGAAPAASRRPARSRAPDIK